jgi:integrase/recombinase XerC
MKQSVFRDALAAASQPQDSDGATLRAALQRFDLEVSWTVLFPKLPGTPGSHSQKNYFSAFKDFLGWAEREGLSLVDPPVQFGAEYQAYLQQKYGDALASINTRLSQARRFYKVFRQLGVVPINLDPFSILERSQVLPGLHRQYYSAAEVNRLLAQADATERALLLLGAHAGLTTAEVLALKWTDVEQLSGTIQLSDRQVPLSPELERALKPISAQQGGGVLFTTANPVFDFGDQNALRASIYALCLKANVPYRAWRGLRHAAGVKMFRESGNLDLVARQLGVDNPHLVRMYQDVVQQEAQEGESAEPA